MVNKVESQWCCTFIGIIYFSKFSNLNFERREREREDFSDEHRLSLSSTVDRLSAVAELQKLSFLYPAVSSETNRSLPLCSYTSLTLSVAIELFMVKKTHVAAFSVTKKKRKKYTESVFKERLISLIFFPSRPNSFTF